MNLLPDEPLWLLEDGTERLAFSRVLEAMQHLQAAHPEGRDWRIDPQPADTARVIRCTVDDGTQRWIVRRA